jgi:hypothetical protein
MFGNLVAWVANNQPELLPVLLNSSLRSTCNPTPVTMRCYNALNFGTPNLVAVIATNCGVPVESATDAAESILALAKDLAGKNQYISSPFGLRFTAAGGSYLSPQFGRKTCMIELPIVKPTKAADQTIDAVLGLLMSSRFHGRPHWGQRFNNMINRETLKNMYPKLEAFREVFKELNPGTFNNEFTKKIGLSA